MTITADIWQEPDGWWYAYNDSGLELYPGIGLKFGPFANEQLAVVAATARVGGTNPRMMEGETQHA